MLVFSSPVFAQTQKPKFFDYTKLEANDWYLIKVIYNGKLSHMLSEHYELNYSGIEVYYVPISEEEFADLSKMDRGYKNKNIHVLAKKEPLFIIYFQNEYDKYIYIYEKRRRWYELYRLWQSEWRLAGQFINPGASESFEDVERILQFLEKRYGIKFVEE